MCPGFPVEVLTDNITATATAALSGPAKRTDLRIGTLTNATEEL